MINTTLYLSPLSLHPRDENGATSRDRFSNVRRHVGRWWFRVAISTQRITTHNCGSSSFPRIASRAHSRLLMHMCTHSLALAFTHYGFTVVHTCYVISIMRPRDNKTERKWTYSECKKCSYRENIFFFFFKTLFLKSRILSSEKWVIESMSIRWFQHQFDVDPTFNWRSFLAGWVINNLFITNKIDGMYLLKLYIPKRCVCIKL